MFVQLKCLNVSSLKQRGVQEGRGFEPEFGSCVPVGRQRDSWNLVLALATPTLESHWLLLEAVGLGLRAQCLGSSRACHSATPRYFLVFWAQSSRRLQTMQRTHPGLDLPPQSSV